MQVWREMCAFTLNLVVVFGLEVLGILSILGAVRSGAVVTTVIPVMVMAGGLLSLRLTLEGQWRRAQAVRLAGFAVLAAFNLWVSFR